MNLFVWDFHGVLERGNERGVIEISNLALRKNNYTERFIEQDVLTLDGLKWYEYFEYLLPNLSHQQHMKLQQDCFDLAQNNIEIISRNIQLNTHAQEVLEKIKTSGHQQILISNTRPTDLTWFITSVNIGSYFDAGNSFGLDAHRKAASKMSKLSSYLKDKEFQEIIVIGDSQKDVDLAKNVNGTSYYYYHDYVKPRGEVQADFIINDLREVLSRL